ncbi:hypothetical protein F5148DRAFT_1152348 [Russula earlei]|uniref:Uncharacterized protein n=1 Tax=Russula earlei TaxID=71964 RepID=A0ACC0TWL3_9AGAM|nr:hypothetical protein F5148DRAFT_1152348 [Russula earlei]
MRSSSVFTIICLAVAIVPSFALPLETTTPTTESGNHAVPLRPAPKREGPSGQLRRLDEHWSDSGGQSLDSALRPRVLRFDPARVRYDPVGTPLDSFRIRQDRDRRLRREAKDAARAVRESEKAAARAVREREKAAARATRPPAPKWRLLGEPRTTSYFHR